MKNYVNSGETLTTTAAADTSSGAIVVIGALVTIAQASAAAGEPLVVVRCGQFLNQPKVEAQAWTQGAKLYWDNTNGLFTTVASGNQLCGFAGAAAANPSTTGVVVLDGVVR